MLEPPLETDSDGTQARPRRVGHAVTDLILAISAIAISVISLVVAVEHGRTERQLVAASTWPFLEVNIDESSDEKTGVVSRIMLRNAGVGPARLVSMVIRLDGKIMHSPTELLAACCSLPNRMTRQDRNRYGVLGEASMLGIIEAHQAGSFLSIGDKVDAVQQAFQATLPRLSYAACYCSVLNECWRSNLNSTDQPKPVSACHPSPDSYS